MPRRTLIRGLPLLALCLGAMGHGVPILDAQPATLRETYRDAFLVGVALNAAQAAGRPAKAAETAARHFSSLTPENALKWDALQPRPGDFRFEAGDALAEFAERHGMAFIGQTLVWHSQTPDWVFRDEGGREATREELLARMKDHIEAAMGRYRGRVLGWDVVNEALSDDDEGSGILRDSPWRRIIGDDYLDHAFRFAREADPGAELYYNDNNLEDVANASVRRLLFDSGWRLAILPPSRPIHSKNRFAQSGKDSRVRSANDPDRNSPRYRWGFRKELLS